MKLPHYSAEHMRALRKPPRIRRATLTVEDHEGRTISYELDGRAVVLNVLIEQGEPEPDLVDGEALLLLPERPRIRTMKMTIDGVVDKPDAAPEGWLIMRIDPGPTDPA